MTKQEKITYMGHVAAFALAGQIAKAGDAPVDILACWKYAEALLACRPDYEHNESVSCGRLQL